MDDGAAGGALAALACVVWKYCSGCRAGNEAQGKLNVRGPLIARKVVRSEKLLALKGVAG